MNATQLQGFCNTFASGNNAGPAGGNNTIKCGFDKMKRSFKIEVDCANCANLIEDAVKKVKGVEEVTVSFMTQKMKIGFEAGSDPESVLEEVRRTARKIEPDFSII